MSSYDAPGETDRGLLLSSGEWTVVAGATGLMAINVVLMFGFVLTPLVAVNDALFAAPILGVLVYGVAIGGGELLAERGIEAGNVGVAVLGALILQLAFGTFGAAILSFLPRSLQLTALGVTAVVTAVVTALIATYVYARSKSFESWGTYATYAFLAGIVAALLGTFVEPVLLAAFVLFFLGFLLRLGWEIWRVRDRRSESVAIQTIGVYVAVAGVFVHVLQLVVRALARR